MTKRKNNLLALVIGIVLCLISMVCIIILIGSVADSLVQKSRLEAIGATVKMKLSFWFFADILVLIISGMLGTNLICKNTSGIKEEKEVCEEIPKKKIKEFVLQDIDYGYDENGSKSNDSESIKTDDFCDMPKNNEQITEASPNSEVKQMLKINYGSSKKIGSDKATDSVKSENQDDGSSEEKSFFTMGGDL